MLDPISEATAKLHTAQHAYRQALRTAKAALTAAEKAYTRELEIHFAKLEASDACTCTNGAVACEACRAYSPELEEIF